MSSTSYLRLGARHWPVALVLTCGLLLGYYILRTYVSPLPREYQLDFGNAQWIQPAANSPIAYFRKKVFVTAVPEQAWLEVGATDSFQITVNGRHVALGAALKTRATGIYDIKSRLQSGTNIIAIEVNRNSFPGPAEILVCGEIKEPGRPAIRIISDEHWKVATTTGIVEGSEPWDSNLVQDETWPNAQKVRKLEPPVSLNWVATNPLLLQLPSVGSWIIARDGRHEAVFSTSVVARRSHQETWIQVASSGDLDLVINGQLVTTLIIEALQEKHLPSAAIVKIAARSPSDQLASSDISTADITATTPLAFKTYDISRWIKRGQNQIIAAVRSDYRPASLIVDGFTVPRPGSVERFQTDSTWQVIGLSLGKQKPKIEQPAEAGSNGSAPWGYLQQGLISDPQLTGFWVVLRAGAVLFLTALAIVAVWLVVSMLIADARDEEPSVVRVRDALFHTPVTVALLFLLLPSYDFRFPNTWSFQPKFVALAVLALLGLRLLHFYQGDLLKNYIKAFAAKFKPPYSRPSISYVLLALITILGFSLRFHALGYISFDHDEMGLVQKSRGVLIYGFPFNEIRGTIKPAVTYELVPYFLALSGAIFGYSEWAMRLPSCLWGTFTIVVIGIMGHRLFNWRTGLIAALIYACLPLNIRWAQNAFYPQQCQFMAMLTFWLFYETIRTRPFGRTWLTWASITFCLTFLSWEGSGFILPALFLALLVVRWGEWWWLKQSYLYRCLFFIGALVVAQFCWRTLAGIPYLTIGSGLSNLSGPSLFFLNYGYRPTFYLEELLLSENHLLLTLMIVLGLFFCWSKPGFRYLVTILVTLLVLYTNCLAALSPRYCYFYQPLIIVSAVAAAVILWDRLLTLAHKAGSFPVVRQVAGTSGFALLALLFVQSNEWLVKDYFLSGEGNRPGMMTRLNTYRYDYRGAVHYVRDHVQPGDIIIPMVSHVFENYSGMKGDYFLDTLLSKKVFYDQKLREPAFIEKFRGYPTIRNLTELQEASHRGNRTWVIFTPYGSLRKLASPQVLDYLDANAKAVFESYRAKVLLIQGASDPAEVANRKGSKRPNKPD